MTRNRFQLMALISAVLAAGPVLAEPVPLPQGQPMLLGYSFLYAGVQTPMGWKADGIHVDLSETGALFSRSAVASPGSAVSVRRQSLPWETRAEVISSHSEGLQYGAVFSAQGVNQILHGTPGESATLTYRFRVDGSFQPGPASHFASPKEQYLSAYIGAHRGHYIGTEVIRDPDIVDWRLITTNGMLSALAAEDSPYYVNSIEDDLLARDFFCMGVWENCSGQSGAFDDILELKFTVEVGEAFSVGSSMWSVTNGTANFFDTVKLMQIVVPQGFWLQSDDGGALRRRPDGSYGLAAVPEPASWTMMIAGFGLIGHFARRRPRALAA